MTEFSAHLDRLKQLGRQVAARVRPQHLAVLAGVAVIGVGVAAVGAMALPGPRAVHDSERLQIQVVAPDEPEITPGSVMEVGHLVDGFVSVPAPQPVAEIAADAPYDDFVEAAKPPPQGVKRYVEEAVIQAPPQPEEPAGGWRDSRVGRWLGFDAPQPDYRAEREARRARREESADQDGEAREARRWRDEGPPPRRRD